MGWSAKPQVFIQSLAALVAALPERCSQIQVFSKDKLAKSRDRNGAASRNTSKIIAGCILGPTLLQWVPEDNSSHTSSSVKCTILHNLLLYHSRVKQNLQMPTSLTMWMQSSIFLSFIIFRTDDRNGRLWEHRFVTYFVEATDQGLCLLNHSSFHSPLNHSLDVLFFVLFCHCCICPSRFQLSFCHLQNKDK